MEFRVSKKLCRIKIELMKYTIKLDIYMYLCRGVINGKAGKARGEDHDHPLTLLA